MRIALGSQRSGILSLVFATAVKLAIVGCAIGLVGTIAASRLMRSFLFGTTAAVFVLLLALAASRLPAHRAASVDPMKALRAD